MRGIHLSSLLRTPAGLSLALGLALATQAGAQSQWVAFNDHFSGPNTGPNVTTWNVFTNQFGAPGNSGFLKDSATGTPLPVTMTITNITNGISQSGTTSSGPVAGTPAAMMFTNQIDFGNGGTSYHAIQLAGASKVAHTFSGLDPSLRYSWHGTAVRGGNYNLRWTMLEISAASWENAHTMMATGVFTQTQIPSLNSAQAVFNSGENRAPGVVVGWTNIVPNADGTIRIAQTTYRGAFPAGTSFAFDAGNYGYAIVADRLEAYSVGPLTAPAIPGTGQPQPVTVDERQVATLTVAATGSGLTYQWFKGGTLIQGATASSLKVTNIDVTTPGGHGTAKYAWSNPSDGGSYYVIVSGTVAPPVESTHVTVTVNADMTPPTLVRAFCGPGADQFTLLLSEPLNNADGEGTDLFQWEIHTLEDAAADTLPLSENAVYTDDGVSTTMVMTAPGRDPLKAYKIVRLAEFPAFDTAQTPNMLAVGASVPILCFTNEIFGYSKTWQYNDVDVDPGPTWPNVGFDDSASPWATGAGPFDSKRDGGTVGPDGLDDCRAMTLYGLGAVGTCLREQSPVSMTNLATAYFRTHFNYFGNPANTYLHLNGKFDDGAIVYLNGTEIWRLRVAAGAIPHAQFSGFGTTVGDTDPQDTQDFVNPPSLVNGNNVLAVVLKQGNVTSSDLTMGLALSVIEATPPVLHPIVTITYSGGHPTISWSPSGGSLQFKHNLSEATWTTIMGATTPYFDMASPADHGFYQVKVP